MVVEKLMVIALYVVEIYLLAGVRNVIFVNTVMNVVKLEKKVVNIGGERERKTLP
jgi:hypothetical protein